MVTFCWTSATSCSDEARNILVGTTAAEGASFAPVSATIREAYVLLPVGSVAGTASTDIAAGASGELAAVAIRPGWIATSSTREMSKTDARSRLNALSSAFVRRCLSVLSSLTTCFGYNVASSVIGRPHRGAARPFSASVRAAQQGTPPKRFGVQMCTRQSLKKPSNTSRAWG